MGNFFKGGYKRGWLTASSLYQDQFSLGGEACVLINCFSNCFLSLLPGQPAVCLCLEGRVLHNSSLIC